jgi:hypothetical protein
MSIGLSPQIPRWKSPAEPSRPEKPPQLTGAKFLFGILLVVIVGVGGWWIWDRSQPQLGDTKTECQKSELVFYYRETCPVCHQVKNEGTLKKIEDLGLKRFDKIEITVGPVEHEFGIVPTFVINGDIYEGYLSFEDIKKFLDC